VECGLRPLSAIERKVGIERVQVGGLGGSEGCMHSARVVDGTSDSEGRKLGVRADGV